MMEADIVMEVLKSLLSQSPLVGLLFYLHVQNAKAIEKKDTENATLNKEMRESLEKHLNKSNEVIVNNTLTMNAFKEALKSNA